MFTTLIGVILSLISLLGMSSATQPEKPAAPVQPAPADAKTTDADKLVYVRLKTSAGDIVVELNREKAPISVANFLAYADKKAYDGTIFHRVIENFVIQGGGYTKELVELKGDKPIKNEWQNGLKNEKGTIGMARDAEPDTATREWYINTADNAKLDTPREMTGKAGYAVFGKVVVGMSVVDTIRKGKTKDIPEPKLENVPVDPVVIETVTRLSLDEAKKLIAEEAKKAKP